MMIKSTGPNPHLVARPVTLDQLRACADYCRDLADRIRAGEVSNARYPDTVADSYVISAERYEQKIKASEKDGAQLPLSLT